MDFGFSPEQELLRESAVRLVQRRCDRRQVRLLHETEEGYSRELWQEMAELGYLGLGLPEEFGGAGGTFLDLAVLLEEFGRHLTPGPFIETAVILPHLLLECGSREQQLRYLPRIATGELRGALAFLERSGRWDEPGIRMSAGPGPRLTGQKELVTWAAQADLLLVPARTPEGGISLCLVESGAHGMSIAYCPSADPGARQYRVNFAGAACELLGTPGGGWPVLEGALQKAAVAASLEILGGARQVLESTAGYLKERVQFDRPLGSFQALKHVMADLHIRVENSSSLVYYAALAISEGQADVPAAAARAKVSMGETGRALCERSIQLQGGNGFSWEYDVHLYLKRALRLGISYLPADLCREYLGQLLARRVT